MGGFASSAAAETSPLDAGPVDDGEGGDDGDDDDDDDAWLASVADAAPFAATEETARGSFTTLVVEVAALATAPFSSLSADDERRQYANPSARMPTATNGTNQRPAAGSAARLGG